MKLARAHGRTLDEYLESLSSRELSLQDALDRLDGPQGQDRMDFCFAWLASWWTSRPGEEQTVQQLHGHLLYMLRESARGYETRIIDDDPALSQRKAAELEAELIKIFPRNAQKE